VRSAHESHAGFNRSIIGIYGKTHAFFMVYHVVYPCVSIFPLQSASTCSCLKYEYLEPDELKFRRFGPSKDMEGFESEPHKNATTISALRGSFGFQV